MSNDVQYGRGGLMRGAGNTEEGGEAQQLVGQTLGDWSLSRRRVLGLMVTMPLAASCGTESEGDGASGGDGDSGGVPNPGVLVIALDDQPQSLDPASVAVQDMGANIVFNVYDRLLDVETEGATLRPALATEVPNLDNGLVTEDGLTYTFPLREGVTFHDGTACNADAVKFSWDRAITMNIPTGQVALFENVAETRVVDDLTFEVTLKSPDSGFLRGSVAGMVASVVSPAAVDAHGGIVAGQPNEWMTQNMVGTGPYTFGEWVRGDHMTFDIYEDYWGEPAHLPVRAPVLVKEQAAMMKAKDSDIMSGVASRIPKVMGTDFITVNTDALNMQLDELGFNMKLDPATLPEGDDIPADFFHDVRVRAAFNYAFPYEAYIQGIMDGYAERANFVIPQGMAGYDPEAPIYQTDPAKAEQLFRETGWWDRGFTMSILADGSNDIFNGAALAMKDGIEKLNPEFHVQVLSVPEAKSDEMMAQDPVPAAMWSYTSFSYAAPSGYVSEQAHPDGLYGVKGGFRNGYSDPDHVAAICEEARVTPDVDRRQEIYSELQRIQYDDAMWVITAQEALPAICSSWVKGYVINPLWPRPYMRWALYDK